MKHVEKAVVLTEEEYAKLQQAAKGKKRNRLKSITAFLFVTAEVAALLWVSASYVIALYATVKLGQVFPVEELSRQAITSLLGIVGLKVAENVVEHNDSWLFGRSNTGSGNSQDNENKEDSSI